MQTNIRGNIYFLNRKIILLSTQSIKKWSNKNVKSEGKINKNIPLKNAITVISDF